MRAAVLDHAPGGLVAGVQRVEGHDAPGEVEPGEQGTNGRDLVALVLYRLLSEDDTGAVLGSGDEQVLGARIVPAAPRMYFPSMATGSVREACCAAQVRAARSSTSGSKRVRTLTNAVVDGAVKRFRRGL